MHTDSDPATIITAKVQKSSENQLIPFNIALSPPWVQTGVCGPWSERNRTSVDLSNESSRNKSTTSPTIHCISLIVSPYGPIYSEQYWKLKQSHHENLGQTNCIPTIYFILYK